MDISIMKRDFIIKNLETQLEILQTKKYQKIQSLKQNKSENNLLESIIDDYKKHYNTILSLKQRQKETIENLIHYIEDAMVEAGISETMLEYSKYEKKKLFHELKTIKNDIDNVTKEINEEI
jgi:hypothetical protein